jgi:hypothetical protein|tara:strand:- start:894 stop:1118 length:225 start_codon:yes stop_codon:yes gene_type:complete
MTDYILYEVGIYNKYVRERIREGDDTPIGIDPRWEDTLLFEIHATSEQHAIQQMQFNYPEKAGFVIDGVLKVRQ